ncbi:MAG: DUF2877 domain-containing protein [Halobacteriaceae archaeon]
MSHGYRRFEVAAMGDGASELWRAIREATPPEEAITVGRVLQTYDRSAYLELDPALTDAVSTPGPSLVLVGGPSFSGPLSMQLRIDDPGGFDAAALAADAACRLRTGVDESGASVLSIGETVDVVFDESVLELGGSTLGCVTAMPEIDRGDPVWTGARAVLRWVIEADLEDGLGWLEAVAAIVEDETVDNDLRSLVAEWVDVLSSAVPPADTEVTAILGRGPGATPSGDDILSGMILAAWAMTRGVHRDRVQGLGSHLVEEGIDRTTTVSVALLAQAAVGRAGDSARAALEALLSPGVSAERRQAAATRLTSVGHTSGTDILVGMLTTVLLVAPQIEG